ncbi:MAG: CapA family protein [Gammaproteobacteria bacterium]|nr:CapA family protein [Gammaproteobacteria bacterium]
MAARRFITAELTVDGPDPRPAGRASRASCALLIIAAVGATAGLAHAAETAVAYPRDLRSETALKITAPFTVAAVGDIIMPQPLHPDDPLLQAVTAGLRDADVAFANMESSLVDFRSFVGPVGGTLAPLEVGESIRALGIDLMSRANNHTFDGGLAGMLSTDEALDRLGIVHAGTGRDLQTARNARFLATPKGRVGLVSLFALEDTGNFGPTYAGSVATYRHGPLAGAPGVNPLHLTTYHVITPSQLQSLREIAGAAYGERERAAVTTADGVERFRFFDAWYEAGAHAGALRYEMNPGDERDILESIRNGKINADFLIAAIHSHQTPRYCGNCQGGGAGSGMKEGVDHYPPDFLVRLAHASIDHGADMFVTHGVHALAGVEIYHGKPIFYGLSNFVFQFAVQLGASYDVMANYRRMSALQEPATQEAVLATSRFIDGRLLEVRLYPVDLGGMRRPLSRMGIPATPSPQDARRILAALQDYSRPFGTHIAIEGNVGVIRVTADGPGAAP